MTFQLRQFGSSQHDLNPAGIEDEDHGAVILKVALVLFADVRFSVFCEPKEERGAYPGPIGNDGAVSAALSFTTPRYPLLDEAVAEVSIDQAAFGATYRVAQRGIIDAFFALKAREMLRPENPQAYPAAEQYSTKSHRLQDAKTTDAKTTPRNKRPLF
jgi:hypothetical protein